MKKYLVSIIIPVYNIKNYITKCIESVISQSYKNLEIILVDDGSSDESGLICDNYAKSDNRIKVIHKKNGGLSDARNVAIDVAKGDFIYFIDGDDYIHHNSISVLIEAYNNTQSDIVTGGFMSVFDSSRVDLDEDFSMLSTKTVQKKEALESLMYQKDTTTSAWGKLYKKSLFSNDIRYPKGAICEDLPTTYKLFSRADRVSFVAAPMYMYRQREGSIIQSAFKPGRIEALDFAEQELDYIEKHFQDIRNAAINRLFMEAVFICQTISLSKIKEHKTYWNRCVNVIKKTRLTVLTDNRSKKIYRMFALLSFMSSKLILHTIYIKSKIRKAL